MFIKSVFLLLPLLYLISNVSAQNCLTENDAIPTSADANKNLTTARFEFALETLKKISLIESKDNIFYSPHSLYQALSLAFFGSLGTTEKNLRKALHISNQLSKTDVQGYYAYERSKKQAQDAESNASPSYEYNSANRLWISSAVKVKGCMLDIFGEELEQVDFRTNPGAIRDHINQWVSNTTKGHIKDLLSSDSIREDTDLVLANAVYFKGIWQSRFDSANSKRDLFYTSGSQHSMVTFMKQKGNFNHFISDVLGAHVLELPYKGDEVSMFIFLPPFVTRAADLSDQPGEKDGIRQLIERLTNKNGFEALREIFSGGIPTQEVEVLFPRFEVEKELPLATLLHSLGVGDLMSPGGADLRGFVQDGEKSLHLGDGVHRARIEVTEEGTTAAAATALYTFRSGRPLQPSVFDANHPFLYFIYHRKQKTILFTGIYRIPNTAQVA